MLCEGLLVSNIKSKEIRNGILENNIIYEDMRRNARQTMAAFAALGMVYAMGISTPFKKPVLSRQKPRETGGSLFKGTRNQTVDFRNARGNSTLDSHASRHGPQMGYKNAQGYQAGARRFLDNPPPNTQSFTSKEGTFFQYHPASNRFLIVNRYGGISTYFKPATGNAYWLEQIRLYGP